LDHAGGAVAPARAINPKAKINLMVRVIAQTFHGRTAGAMKGG
jgi:hypothetical protein